MHNTNTTCASSIMAHNNEPTILWLSNGMLYVYIYILWKIYVSENVLENFNFAICNLCHIIVAVAKDIITHDLDKYPTCELNMEINWNMKYLKKTFEAKTCVWIHILRWHFRTIFIIWRIACLLLKDVTKFLNAITYKHQNIPCCTILLILLQHFGGLSVIFL